MDSLPLAPLADIKEFLRPLLLGLAEEDLDELAQAAVVRFFQAGEVICQEGEPGDAAYALVEGRVEISKQLDEANEHHLHYTGPGEFFGEMAIIQEGARTATVRAVEPTTVLEIGQEPFLRVMGRSPSLAIRVLSRLTDRLRDADQQAIAKLRQANEELTQALHKLERLDRTKANFIQVSAHELRTPVAALLGYAQMLRNNPTVQGEPQLRALVEGIVTSTKRLHRSFNNILDVSRVMSRGPDVHRSPASIPLIVRGIALEFQQALEKRNLTLEQEIAEDLPLYSGNPDLLYKAFYHLVNNGIKYTPDGGRITVSVHMAQVPDLGECIEVVVEDTGVGIANEDLDLIFEKFYRTGEVALYSSGTTTFKGGGPGLGLAIAQGAILAHGGRIKAESPGYDEETCPGSRFVVQLPLAQQATAQPD